MVGVFLPKADPIAAGDAPVSARMSGAVEVAVVGEEDWRAWRAMRRQALAEAPAAFGSTLAQWSGTGDHEQRWRTHLREVALNLALHLDGQPAGRLSATDPGTDGTVTLISMWVAPHARGRGVGDAAIDAVLAWARREHPRASVVLSVKTANAAATRLH
jgi:GNAT superfamily N-acetyltransferase